MANPENRSEGRSNVFLTATLNVGGTAIPVRIRNIATRGVLVEAPFLPAVGTRITLTRGQLSATGELTWDGAGQAGISFHHPIQVDSWVRKTGHAGQQHVDRIVSAIRNTGKAPTLWHDPVKPSSLAELSAELDQACERLASIPEASIEFGEALIALDAVAQALRALATGKTY
jgi:hypothetical protein